MDFDTKLYFITDSTCVSGELFLPVVEAACKGGATIVQLREKCKSTREYLQLAAATPNFLIHEMMLTDGKFRSCLTNENVKYEDGCLLIGDPPGLGIDVNIDEVLKHPYKPRMLRHYTGTLTDIRPKGDTFYFFDGLDRENPVF